MSDIDRDRTPPSHPLALWKSYFRVQPADRDPRSLLDPEHQETEPWGESDEGLCVKCGGSGATMFECGMCKADGPNYACPVCGGRIRYEDECPACKGSGHIAHERRKGVSAFPDEAALYRYLLDHNARLDETTRVIELEGELSEEQDFDADEGALLIRPRRIADVHSLDWQLLSSLSRGVVR